MTTMTTLAAHVPDAATMPAGRRALMDLVRENLDPDDRFGSVMATYFAICETVYAADNTDDMGTWTVPSECEYRPALGTAGDTLDEVSSGAEMNGDITTLDAVEIIRHERADADDAFLVLRVLHRYVAQLELAGETY